MALPVKTLYSKDHATSKKRDDFDDILEERRCCSDIRYAMKCYTPVVYRGLIPCKPNDLKNIVLKSEHVQHVIQKLSRETGECPEIWQEEATVILEEMGHSLQLSAVRFFAFTLSKVFKTLFQGVFVNEEGIQRLHQAVQEHPVVLLPSHRSYIDFLMLSYILYTYDIALPVIAAGMDFMGMKLIGEMLRMSGAFFIRRTFGGNKLYWAVFSEYVKTILRNGFAPVEFFVEGTRSRTCKSLTPKLGLLNIVMEPFLKGEVFDIYLVPISISYDRILEESLYSHELLGVPKPKESTSGLFKARKILSDNFGNIHVYFGNPISLRTLASGRINRTQYSLIPRHIPQRPTEDVQVFVDEVGYKMVLLQLENIVIGPFALVATILLQDLSGVHLSSLAEKTLWLKQLTQSFGGFVKWPIHLPTDKVLMSTIALHHNIVNNIDGHIVLSIESKKTEFTEDFMFRYAVGILMCAAYRNQLLNVFVRPAFVAVACEIAHSSKKEDIYSCFTFLRDLFSDEFIFFPGSAVKDFEDGCFLLTKCDAIQVLQQEILVLEKDITSFLKCMFSPYVEGYQVLCSYLSEEASENFTEKQFLPGLRQFAFQQLKKGNIKYYEILSSDMQKNALSSLVRLGALKKMKMDNETTFVVKKDAVSRTADILSSKLPVGRPVIARL
ncbi:dihydroxyacetone phosphate acyltransferase isoform X1 [Latimeria chalumnae]|uniref:dihydroxyacetone phosphate acyltransferase isoform X1 n=1 Tax=Latimeria chalumnae TaxID=7897 RepID=UPI0006D92060|nr:PREDICTED: dihydroxyacetone phosphate acyltransferase [Latimeria chalumnae]|eukprot:XP_014342344.1 PREDICTED: dihydroxyacetone phosphate acyltransferase [Latimeria chalumnae]